jgi:release factor glutamine methyltransferase
MSVEIEGIHLTNCNTVYNPAEDTFLLLDTFKHLIKSGDLDFSGKVVLELGTGTGLVSLWIAKNAAARPDYLVATDISPHAAQCARTNVILNSMPPISILCSDLFSAFGRSAKFDIIIFNPPYVPSNSEDSKKPKAWESRAWNGGVQGREIIDRFLRSFADYLSGTGQAFLIHSSLNMLAKTREITKAQGFDLEIVGKTKLTWETLWVLELIRS